MYISKKQLGIPNALKGKTYEEIYGIEVAKERKNRKSQLMSGNTLRSNKKLKWVNPLKGTRREGFHKSSLTLRVRGCWRYFEWRTLVFKRDNYTCRHCGRHGGYLEADHVIPFYLLIDKIRAKFGDEDLYEKCLQSEELWDTNNGRTLCEQCHKETDTYAGKLRWKK